MDVKKKMETEVDSLLKSIPQLVDVDRKELLEFTLSLMDKYDSVTNRHFDVV